MTDELIEAVARVIKAEVGRQMDATPLPGTDSEDWTATGGTLNLSVVARAAILETLRQIREPSEGMIAEIGRGPFGFSREIVQQEGVVVWQAMIDHLIAEIGDE